MKKKNKEDIPHQFPPRFFTEPRATIVKLLIDELTLWESTEKVTTSEFLRLVDKLEKIMKTKTK